MPPAAALDRLLLRLTWEDLDRAHLRRLIELARDEDLSGLGLAQKPSVTGDRSTAALATTPRLGRAHLVARTELVACGLPLLPLILSAYGPRASVQTLVKDGRRVAAGSILATLEGDPRVLLAAERVALNFLQRLSGVATTTAAHVAALGPGRTRLLDTRKTTPGYRMLEKYAVACGGAWNHRLGLFDRVMLKDNHLALLGSPDDLAAAVARAKKAAPDLAVEVEIDRLDQLPAVLAAGADVVMFDNFPPARIKKAITLVAGRAFTEASGGITLKTLPRYAGLGLDFVSTGALVHKSPWADIGLDWQT
ncbi:MAG: carboxylating nicotinate-nucleotide diphosphorylase [Burkholderiales bacterium]|nr:carboxylating nicotinate-nucleotide diphosphorylase [Opitutaceae bacterium]